MREVPTVRPAALSDVEAIAEVHVRSWQVAYRGAFPDEFLDGLSEGIADRVSWRTSALREPRSRSATLVAEERGTVIGFVDTSPTRDDALDLQRVGEVLAIYVDPPYWGRGFGRRLLAAAEERMLADGFQEAMLWVLEHNDRARRFYEKAGWIHDGASKVDRFGGHEISEVRYRKSLA